jgi:hydrogenase expression/formation protein HypD
VVTGFEPLDLLEGIRRVILQLEQRQCQVENAYARVVSEKGNLDAQSTIDEVFERCDQAWRGLGIIPASGWRLREEFSGFDAEHRFGLLEQGAQESPICRAGQVLTGMIKPHQCEAFGSLCTPRNPLGAPMVSSEGACAAYYLYGKHPHPIRDRQEH